MTFKQRSLWIPVPADLRGLVLLSAHPKLWSFVRLCNWCMLLLGPKPPLTHSPVLIVCLATNSFKDVIPQVKNSLLRLLRTCTCPRFQKNPIVILAAHPGPGHVLSHGIMRFTPPPCDYSRSPSTSDLQFSSASQLRALMKIRLWDLSLSLER